MKKVLTAMIALLAIIGLVMLISPIDRYLNARFASTDLDRIPFETGLEQYRNLSGYYPSTSQGLQALVTEPTETPRPRR